MLDIAVVGAGPAGYSAAITARKRDKSVVVIGQHTGWLARAEHIANYPGLPDISGPALLDAMRAQAQALGAQLRPGVVHQIVPMGESFGLSLGADFVEARTVVLCTGAKQPRLLPGEGELLGRGASYCGTCDGMLYRGKTVALIGNSREAKEDADFLADIGCRVLRFEENGRYEISGGLKADTLKFRGQEYKVDCVFIIKDTVSVTRLVPGLNYEKGGIVTDRHMATNLPGVFAAGDCTGKPYQLPKAVGEGNIAALSACEYLDSAK